MTTIAYKQGKAAADTGLTLGGSRISQVTKIVERDGHVAGASGCAAWASAFAKGVIFRHDGRIEVFESSGSFETRADFYAIGSGQSEARGAMQVGASAEQAVRAAMVLDDGTWGDVIVLNVGPVAA